MSIASICFVVGCTATEPEPEVQAEPDAGAAVPEPDPRPDPKPDPETQPEPGAARGPGMMFDSIAITGKTQLFATLGNLLLNPQLESSIDSGQLLLAFEVVDLDDPSGQNDPDVSLRIAPGTDVDGDPSNNFDPDEPAAIIVPDAQLQAPFVGSIAGGQLSVTFDSDFEIAGFALSSVGITGTIVPAADGTSMSFLADAVLSGPIPSRALAAIPSGAVANTCPSATLLDVMVRGCLFVPGAQPDFDADGDGLETLFDDDDDGSIDRCVDGDSTEVLGAGCETDPRFVDGYELEISAHATRVLLFDAAE